MILSHFRTKLWGSLLTVAIVTLFVKLSIWQWHRYQFKKTFEQSYAMQWQATPQPISNILIQANKTTAPLFYYKISATGHYEPQQFLLDNRTKNNQIGFDVITPFKLTTGETILVDRGFILADVHRHINLSITPPPNKMVLIGLLTKPSKNFILGPVVERQKNPAWPLVVMRLDPKSLSIPLHYPLLSEVILLDPNQTYGFLRQWSPPHLWAAQSLGYCFQWLAMALAVIVIYFVMIFK